MGCNTKFSPLNKAVRICPDCEHKKAHGQCTYCGSGEYPRDLNRVGHCSECQQMEDKFSLIDNSSRRLWCKTCEEELKEDEHFNLCNTCLTKQDTCKHCSTNTKYVSEFACNQCKRRYMNQGKTYKLPL